MSWVRFSASVSLALYCVVFTQPLKGDDPPILELSLPPAAISKNPDFIRFLPADHELKDGNAAVVLLRSIWEKQPFMQNTMPKIAEWAKLRYDDPRILTNFPFDAFQREFRRAAYMRTADWNYAMDGDQAMILLPDVSGLRTLAGQGLSLWIGQRIAQNELTQAQEGILCQLAIARHIGRTPLLVNRFTANAIATMALDKIELLIQQPDCPNLYWALSMLPDSLNDEVAAIQRESQMLQRSLRGTGDLPAEGDANEWKRMAGKLLDLLNDQLQRPLALSELKALEIRLQQTAKEYLRSEAEYTEERLGKMCAEEMVMRWILSVNQQIYCEIESAYSLPPMLAIERLKKLEEGIRDLKEKVKAPAIPFPENSLTVYMTFRRFDRRVKLLQVVEAIRDKMAHNNRQFPTSLNELSQYAPFDPVTGLPFDYSKENEKWTLRIPNVPNTPRWDAESRTYELSMIDGS